VQPGRRSALLNRANKTSPITVPTALRTARLQLRPWRADDAPALLPILEANVQHLHWIPAHVAAPAPVAELAQRLANFAADFEAGRSWRYGVFALDDGAVCGEISLFPRAQEGRVHVSAADRLEIGYWLRQDVTGRGYATEASAALLAVASTLPGMRHVEIRCDPRNAPSAAVPRRLGFRLLAPGRTQSTQPDAASADMVWVYDLASQLAVRPQQPGELP
jgi:RimJ/RimL family protein N-acetyltransferase